MILDKIKALIVDQTGISADSLDLSTSLMSDIEADSLDAVEIIMAIEEEYDIEIPDEEAEKFQSVRDLVEYVEEQI